LTGAPLLEVEDLTVAIGGAAVVDGVSFTLARGEILALVGESGCGKSLTVLALIRLLPSAASLVRGRVVLEGRELQALAEPDLRRLRGEPVACIFQEPVAALDPLMPVGRQVIEAIRAHRPVGRREAGRRVLELFRAVGISEPERRLGQYPFQLSGGMCQRVMIAMALACDPTLLLADEPTTALDVTIQAQILYLIKRLRAERGTSILLITHDMGVVAEMADRVAVMYAGRIVEEAPVHQLFAEQRHPYTRLLLGSIPRLDIAPKSQLMTIEGSVPAPGAHPRGCRFADRCPLVVDHCRKEEPPLEAVAPGRRSACWRHRDVPAFKAHLAA
jgi:peptide/nickel transport system ATP-binding protein